MESLFPAPAAPPLRPAVLVDLDVLLLPGTDRVRPEAAAAFAVFARAGYALAVLASRAELARDGFAREGFARRQALLARALESDGGITLAAFELCPHAPDAHGRPACLCRKPAPGLLVRTARMHRLDLAASWHVGGTLDDVEAGRRAGCRTVLLDHGAERAWRLTPLRSPHRRAPHWDDAVEAILAALPALGEPAGPPSAARATGVRPGAARAWPARS